MAGEAIFIGYRRDDTADVAGRIFDALAQRFGRARVFKDVDNIGPGVDFGDYIKSVLPSCRVALILIGPNWLESQNDGKRRIDDDQDWVRIEIETALATPGLLVVPVLVNGARMPRSEEVPDGLRPLLRRNAAIIRRDPDFHTDAERLATALRGSVNSGVLDLTKIGGAASASPAAVQKPNASRRMPLLASGVIAATVLMGMLIWQPWRLFNRTPLVERGNIAADVSNVAETGAGGQTTVPEQPDFGTLLVDASLSQHYLARGQRLAAQCVACHTFSENGPNLVGPNLADAFGSTPGTHPGFEYSEAMRTHGGIWNYYTLNDFLRSPNAAVRGTKMGFAGLSDEQDRIAMIAYLRSVSSRHVPIPAPMPRQANPAPG